MFKLSHSTKGVFLKRILIRYFRDAYSLPMRESGCFIGELGGQMLWVP